MKKLLLTTLLVVTFFSFSAVSASAVVNDMVKVGLRYGSSALFSANLENEVGEGYSFGYFDEERDFEAIGWTEETRISMTAAGDIYMDGSGNYSDDDSNAEEEIGAWHVQIDGFDDFDEAQETAWEYDDAYPAWIDFEYVVRIGSYDSKDDAEDAADELGEGDVVKSSDTGIIVTVTRSTDVLFEFDCSGVENLGVMPEGSRRKGTETWFKGYKYRGGFEYARVTGGNINVINVVDLEDYVKGVIPYEMDDDWPLAALEAQAVCARTYVCGHSKHLSSYGFDVCNTTDCQVYYGTGSGGAAPSDDTDEAVENTEGECLYYDGDLAVTAVYHSSNGGATEDAQNVWGGKTPYLIGKEDPYEEELDIPNYEWSVTYTASELTWILEQKGYSIGTVKNVYISEYTPMGNVQKVTFEGSKKDLTVNGDTCRTIFYSSTYNKSVRSMRFDINGSKAGSGVVYVNNSRNKLSTLEGVHVLSGTGTLTELDGSAVRILSEDGISKVELGGSKQASSGKKGNFTITGTGNGHNVGMSQYGARAMAEMGYDYDEILEFYYTDVTIE